MSDPRCIICGDFGIVALGIRARYSNTNAVWAPNLDAYMCREHALAGCEVELTITPTLDGRVTTRTHGPRGEFQTSLVIGAGVKVTPGQEALL